MDVPPLAPTMSPGGIISIVGGKKKKIPFTPAPQILVAAEKSSLFTM